MSLVLRTLSAVEQGDYETAAVEMLDSKGAGQVGVRDDADRGMARRGVTSVISAVNNVGGRSPRRYRYHVVCRERTPPDRLRSRSDWRAIALTD